MFMRNTIAYNLKDWKKKMLKNGQTVYFLVQGYIMKGKVFHIQVKGQEYTFQIEGYANCSGHHEISSRQIHYSIFLDEQEAKKYQDNPAMYLESHC